MSVANQLQQSVTFTRTGYLKAGRRATPYIECGRMYLSVPLWSDCVYLSPIGERHARMVISSALSMPEAKPDISINPCPNTQTALLYAEARPRPRTRLLRTLGFANTGSKTQNTSPGYCTGIIKYYMMDSVWDIEYI